MKLISAWNLWLLPLIGIFEFFLIQKKTAYVTEQNKINGSADADDYRAKVLFTFLLFLPFIIIATNRSLAYGDSGAYSDMFNAWPNKLSDIHFSDKEKYPGFEIFSVFIKQFISKDFRVWFFIMAFISIICMAMTYRKYTSEIVLCAYLFWTADFQGWVNNGCRQFMVATILFALSRVLFDKKLTKYLLFILFAILLYYFHISALVALPLYFAALGKPMNKRTLIVILLIVIAIVFVGQFSGLISDSLENTAYEKSSAEISATDSGTNVIRVLFFSVPTVLAIIFRKKIDESAPQIIAYSINMSMIGTAFYVLSAFMNGVSMGRMPIYFTLYNYILIPWEIRTFFRKENQKIVFIVFIIAFFVFYAYQMSKWGIGLS